MDDESAMQAYYARDRERERLAAGLGRFEFERTIEVIGRTLPAPPVVVADVGGGPGRYTDWFVDRGDQVIHRDPVGLHVGQVQRRHGATVDSRVGDARSLDLDDASVDVVLMLGPLYHLPDPADRSVALHEANRVVRPGGVVHVAAISRWATRIHGILVEQAHREYPELIEVIDEVERTGVMPPMHDGGFTGFAHTPEQFRREMDASPLVLESLVSVEGVAAGFGDLDERLDEAGERALLLAMVSAVESVPDLLGVGPHLLASARRPT